MTKEEYERIQARLSRKLRDPQARPWGLSGNRKEGYEMGINAAKSILKEIFETQNRGDQNNGD